MSCSKNCLKPQVVGGHGKTCQILATGSTIRIVFINRTWSVRYCNSLAAPEDWIWQGNLVKRKMYHEDNKNC